jgi:hypothetical protein
VTERTATPFEDSLSQAAPGYAAQRPTYPAGNALSMSPPETNVRRTRRIGEKARQGLQKVEEFREAGGFASDQLRNVEQADAKKS